jgi:endonuclease YncB( thermonuclease family)
MPTAKAPFQFNVRSITRVVDGDTLWANLDLGVNLGYDVEVRLNGVDAPENHTVTKPHSAIVIDAIQKWIAKNPKLVLLSYELEKYGRVLGDLVPAPTVSIPASLTQYLLANKLVKAYKGDAKTPWLAEELAVIKAFKPPV